MPSLSFALETHPGRKRPKNEDAVGYALTSLGPEVADARRLGELLLSRWEVENRSFWVRDVLFREDACQVRGVGAQVLAALRAFLVSLLHRQGVREKRPWRPSPSTPSLPCASWGSMRYSGQVCHRAPDDPRHRRF